MHPLSKHVLIKYFGQKRQISNIDSGVKEEHKYTNPHLLDMLELESRPEKNDAIKPVAGDKDDPGCSVDVLPNKASTVHLCLCCHLPKRPSSSNPVHLNSFHLADILLQLAALVLNEDLQEGGEEGEHEVEDQPDVDVLHVGPRAGQARVDGDVERGEDHEDGQVRTNDWVEDVRRVPIVVGALAEHVEENCWKIGRHENPHQVPLIRDGKGQHPS